LPRTSNRGLLIGGKDSRGRDGQARRHRRYWHHGHGDDVQLVKGGFAEGAMARSAEAGGVASTSPRDVAEKAEILITSLPNVGAFKQVMAEQAGIRPAARPQPWIRGAGS
jgi:hypothetical protein